MENPLDISLLNDKCKDALRQFKERFTNYPEDYLRDEHYLMHWLKARNFNVNDAEAMLKNHLRYRNALDMDNPDYVNYKVHKLLDKFYPHGVFGHDKEGHPVAYYPIGGVDPKGITCNAKASDQYKAVFWWQEERNRNCAFATKKYGKLIQQCFYLLDLKGLGTRHLWKPGVEFLQKIFRNVEQHTPEIMYKVYIVNAPSIFPVFYKLIAPIVDENTRRKIHIYGENYQQALLEVIDKEDLPVHYGGTATDELGDPKCGKYLCLGGKVSPDYYYTKPFDEISDVDLTEIFIRRNSQKLFYFEINEPDSVLSWFFKCDSTFDIGFAVYRKLDETNSDNVNDMEMVVPYFRLITCYVPESGDFAIKQKGTYVVQFDNTYSWLYGKYIKYKIELKNAKKNE